MTDTLARWQAALRENERTVEAIRESCDSIAAGLAEQAEALRTIRDKLAEKRGGRVMWRDHFFPKHAELVASGMDFWWAVEVASRYAWLAIGEDHG